MTSPLPFGPWWDAYRGLLGDDDDFPVVPVALTMSHIVQGGRGWTGAEARLAELEELTQRDAASGAHDPARAARAIVERLAELGFTGDAERYEDPSNSFLDRVLERRRGLPITLSVLAIHLARHAGVPLRGVGFPGHFMVGLGLDGPDPLVLDPFHGGQVVSPEQLGRQLARITGGRSTPGAWRRFARPAPSREIVARMLRNLVNHLRHAGRPEQAAAAERLLRITEAEGGLARARAPD